MTRSRAGATVLLIAAFVLGGLLDRVVFGMIQRRAHGGDHRRPSFVERLGSDLQLTPAQRDSVQAILDRHQPSMDSLWSVIRPQFESERQGIRQEVTALLNPDQRAKFIAITQRQDSLHRAEQDRSRNGRR